MQRRLNERGQAFPEGLPQHGANLCRKVGDPNVPVTRGDFGLGAAQKGPAMRRGGGPSENAPNENRNFVRSRVLTPSRKRRLGYASFPRMSIK